MKIDEAITSTHDICNIYLHSFSINEFFYSQLQPKSLEGERGAWK